MLRATLLKKIAPHSGYGHNTITIIQPQYENLFTVFSLQENCLGWSLPTKPFFHKWNKDPGSLL